MRFLFAIPLLAAAGCSVNHDANNDQVTIQYNEEQAQETASDVGNTAENVGAAIANSAEDAANAVRNTDVDVDVKDRRDETTNRQ